MYYSFAQHVRRCWKIEVQQQTNPPAPPPAPPPNVLYNYREVSKSSCAMECTARQKEGRTQGSTVNTPPEGGTRENSMTWYFSSTLKKGDFHWALVLCFVFFTLIMWLLFTWITKKWLKKWAFGLAAVAQLTLWGYLTSSTELSVFHIYIFLRLQLSFITSSRLKLSSS